MFEANFDPQKDLTMVFGENGSGKSTILDAIDVVCNGTIGCLGEISVGQSPGKYLCAVGSPSAALKATVYSGTESWTGALRKNTIEVSGQATKPHAKILRRSRILELVSAPPNERYKALRRFIDIGAVEQSEATLQQQINETNRDMNDNIAVKARMENQLESLWEAEKRPGPGTMASAWAQSKANSSITELTMQLTKLKEIVAAIQSAVNAKDGYVLRQLEATSQQSELAAVEEAIRKAPSINVTNAVKLLESLEKAKTYIEAEAALDKCPTCQRPIGRAELLQTVIHEFSQLSDLKHLTDQRQAVQKRLEIASANETEAQTKLISCLSTTQAAVASVGIAEVDSLHIQWPSRAEANPDIAGLVQICDLLNSVRLGLEEDQNIAQRDISQYNSIKEMWRSISEASQKVTELDRIKTGLDKACDIIHNKRVGFVRGDC